MTIPFCPVLFHSPPPPHLSHFYPVFISPTSVMFIFLCYPIYSYFSSYLSFLLHHLSFSTPGTLIFLSAHLNHFSSLFLREFLISLNKETDKLTISYFPFFPLPPSIGVSWHINSVPAIDILMSGWTLHTAEVIMIFRICLWMRFHLQTKYMMNSLKPFCCPLPKI